MLWTHGFVDGRSMRASMRNALGSTYTHHNHGWHGQLNLSFTVLGALSKLCHWMRQGRISPDWTQNIGLLIFHPSIGQVCPVYKDPNTGKGGLLNYHNHHNQSFVTGSTVLTTIFNGNWTLTEWQKNHCFLIDVALSIGTLSYLFGDCSHSH